MGVKKRREIANTPLSITQQLRDKLTDTNHLDASLLEFVRASSIGDQMGALKKVAATIEKSWENDFNCCSLAIEVLVNVFLSAPQKHQMKRAVASSLQSLPCETIHLEVQREVCQQVQGLMSSSISNNELQSRRNVVDNIKSLLENFPLGETSICSMATEGLSFLSDSLHIFQEATRSSRSPVEMTARTHDCYATTQAFNKLTQRSFGQLQRLLQAEDVGQVAEKQKLLAALKAALKTFAVLLSDESYLLDCRATCGVAVPLVMKVASTGSVTKQICHHLLRRKPFDDVTHQVSPLFGDLDMSDLSQSSYVCVLNGILAMLDIDDLVAECGAEGQIFLVDIIGLELLQLEQILTDSYTKLMASKTLSVLTGKMCAALETCHHDNQQRLRERLHGDAPVTRDIIQYAWTHWEDSVDTIRHQARIVFDNLLKCHLLAVGESAQESQFLLEMTKSLLAMSWHSKGKYGPLCCMVSHLGACTLLELQPDLPTLSLGGVSEQTLANVASELFEKLFSSHLKELEFSQESSQELSQESSQESPQESRALSQWHSTWVDPLLDALCHGSTKQKTFLIEYVVPKLLKFSPQSIKYITAQLSSTVAGCPGERLGALVTCLKRAKSQGILKLKTLGQGDKLWNGVVPLRVVRQALCHGNEQIRLDAFGLLCEHHRTTEVIPVDDLDLVLFFLPLNLCSQTPSFRQHLVALLKKLFIRLHEGGKALQRNFNIAKERGKETEPLHVPLRTYKSFLQGLCCVLFNCLHPAAAFPTRTTALSALSMLVKIMGGHDLTDSRSEEFHIVEVMTPERIQTLLECFTDTFEANKIEAYTVLTSLSSKYRMLQDVDRLSALLQCGLQLASSTKPQDSTTAAYLLKLLAQQPNIGSCLEAKSGTKQQQQEEAILADSGHCLILQTLVGLLREHVSVARQSLLHAAATKPLYPTMHCIRYLLADVQLRAHGSDSQWRRLVTDIISTCFEVAELVSPIVSNSSPEGNVPADAILGPGLTLEAVTQSEEEQQLLQATQDSETKVSLMPEYLIVCCWRSIKEVSLMLGQLTRTAPIMDSPGGAGDGDRQGLITVAQLHEIGSYFTTQLLESRHRGAFELAYAGFVNMTEMLWKCPVAGLHKLPKQWLQEILTDVKSRDPNSRLCSTRRSAGVPFYVQALVSTEPLASGRNCFKQMMSELLVLAKLPQSDAGVENTAQVHALNILRALFRDTRLGDDVFPFIADGLQAAILGYSSQLWGIRNSATLLYSALVVRIFGVKRTKDELNKKNCMTGRIFFHRFPALFEFLLQQLKATTQHVSDAGRLELHPGLYPVLMVLGRLYPSVIEGSDSNLNLKDFIPFVTSCGCSPVYKTRVMAARALQPLVARDQLVNTLAGLSASLSAGLPQSKGLAMSQNSVHGCLLQMQCLLEDLPEDIQDQVIHSTVVGDLTACSWLATRQNPCYVTRTAFIQVAETLLHYQHSHSPGGATAGSDLRPLQATIQTTVTEALLSTSLAPAPGLSDFHDACCRCFLSTLVTSGGEPEKSLVEVLQSSVYEVRLGTLRWLRKHLKAGHSSPRGAEEEEEESDDEDGICHTAQSSLLTESLYAAGLFAQLVAMAMGEEYYPDCLAEVLQTLYLHPLSTDFPWKTTAQEYSLTKVLHRILSLTSHRKDIVRCASVQLTAVAVPGLYQAVSQGDVESLDLLDKWRTLVDTSSTTEQSVAMRLATATVLTQNAHLVLLDHDQALDCAAVLELWTVSVRLLQDEDSAVRNCMTAVIDSLRHCIPAQHRELCWSGSVEPPYALGVVLDTMLAVLGERAWSQCVATLLDWVLHDLEPDWPVQENEVRLFDKGEMNTYRDDTNFALLAAAKLRHFLCVTMTTVQSEQVAIATGGTEQVTVTTNDGSDPVAVTTAGDTTAAVETKNRRLAKPGKVQSDNTVIKLHNKHPETNMSEFSADSLSVSDVANHKKHPERCEFLAESLQHVMDELGCTLEGAKVVSPACPFLRQPGYQSMVTQLSRGLLALRGLMGAPGLAVAAADSSTCTSSPPSVPAAAAAAAASGATVLTDALRLLADLYPSPHVYHNVLLQQTSELASGAA